LHKYRKKKKTEKKMNTSKEVHIFQEGDCYVLEVSQHPDNVLEGKMFHPDYFFNVGFPSVTISIVGPAAADNPMLGGEGGNGDDRKEISWPYKLFLEAIEPNASSMASAEEKESILQNVVPSIHGPDFYRKIVGEEPPSQTEKKPSPLKQMFDTVKEYFASKPPQEQPSLSEEQREEPEDPEEQPPVTLLTEEQPLVTLSTDEQPPPVPPVTLSTDEQPPPVPPVTLSTEEPKQPEQSTPSFTQKWKIRICGDLLEETDEQMALREYRAKKLMGIDIVNGQVYQIGPRKITIGEVVAATEPQFTFAGGPEGSIGNKWKEFFN
jgi:hypothetical protein